MIDCLLDEHEIRILLSILQLAQEQAKLAPSYSTTSTIDKLRLENNLFDIRKKLYKQLEIQETRK